MQRAHADFEVRGSGGSETEPFVTFTVRCRQYVQTRARARDPWLEDRSAAEPVVVQLPPMTREEFTRFITDGVTELAYMGEKPTS